MFSSALARRVCTSALRPPTLATRALPACSVPSTSTQLRVLSQAAARRQPPRASEPPRLLGNAGTSNYGGWQSFMSEINDQSKTSSARTAARPRAAQAEGVTADSVYDGIRGTMPSRVKSTAPVEGQPNYDEEWRERSAFIVPELVQRPVGNAYTGRSFPVINGEVNEAYKQLQRRLNGNNVREELRRMARHEKKGVKRRRLASERWRRRFAEEVRKKVQLVQQIQARRA